MAAAGRFEYEGKQGEEYHARRSLPGQAERWISRVRARKLQRYVGEKDAVFEYGVGLGWNLMSLGCRERAGFDLAGTLENEVEGKGIGFVSRLEGLEDRFEVVICHHTLEHVPKPLEVLKQLARLLRKGGNLLLFVPLERERKYRRINPEDKAHHLYAWTPAAFRELVAAAGFKVVSVQTPRFRFDRAAALVAYKLRLGETGYRAIRAVGQLLFPEHEIALVAQKQGA